MSEINPKLMDAAHKVARAAHDADVGNEPIFSQIGLRIIAAAIAMERSRCAAVVEDWKSDLVNGELIQNAIHRLADRIRRGE